MIDRKERHLLFLLHKTRPYIYPLCFTSMTGIGLIHILPFASFRLRPFSLLDELSLYDF